MEVSGLQDLNYAGLVNASAPLGEAGELLLDPINLTIGNIAAAAISGTLLFTDVTIDTPAATGGAGNITLNGDIIWGTSRDLTFRAHKNITLNGDITSLGSGNLALYAGAFSAGAAADITLNSTISFSGTGSVLLNADRDLFVNAPASVTTASGDVDVIARNVTVDGDLAAGGDLDIQNTGIFAGATDSLSAGGKLDVNQKAGGFIQNAIDAILSFGAPGDATIHVGAGTYNENVTIDKAVNLISTGGRDVTTIQGISGVGALGAVVIANGVNGASLGGIGQGFTIEGIDNGAPGIENAAVYFQGDHDAFTIQGNRINANGDEALVTEYNRINSNLLIDGNIFGGKTFVGAVPATGNQFVVPNVSRQLVALNKGLTDLTFSNNEIIGNAGNAQLVAIESDGATITGNSFDGASSSAALRVRGSDALIAENTLVGDNVGQGIWTQNVANQTIGGASALDGNSVSGFKNGIVVNGASGTTLVQNNNASNNKDTANRATASYTTGIGILVNNSTGSVTVANNTTNNNDDGIRILDTDAASLGQVVVSNNSASGSTKGSSSTAAIKCRWTVTRSTATTRASGSKPANKCWSIPTKSPTL